MITKEQFDKLPDLFKQIILVQRQINEALDDDSVSLKSFGELIKRRKELCSAAARQYGDGLVGDKTKT